MSKKHPRNPAVLTVAEARKLGVQLSDEIETCIGTFKNKKGQRVFIRPAEWIIDKSSIIMVDITNVDYKRKH